MYKFIAIFCFFLIPLSVSAQFEKGMTEYKGMRYKIREVGKGTTLTDSSIIQVHLKVFNNMDSLLQSTYTEEMPSIINLRKEESRQTNVMEILMKGNIGDSLTVFTNVDSLFRDEIARPNVIPKGSWIRQEFHIVRDYTLRQYAEVMMLKLLKQDEEQEEFSQQVIIQQHKTDSILKTQIEYIENIYFVEKGITDYKKTESGLFYKIEKEGITLKKGDKVKVDYEANLLMTGEKFDSSFGREPFGFVIGQEEVIKGWDEGIPLIGKGGKGTLYIPAKLGYGSENVSKQISPNSILIYRVEVLEN